MDSAFFISDSMLKYHCAQQKSPDHSSILSVLLAQ